MHARNVPCHHPNNRWHLSQFAFVPQLSLNSRIPCTLGGATSPFLFQNFDHIRLFPMSWTYSFYFPSSIVQILYSFCNLSFIVHILLLRRTQHPNFYFIHSLYTFCILTRTLYYFTPLLLRIRRFLVQCLFSCSFRFFYRTLFNISLHQFNISLHVIWWN